MACRACEERRRRALEAARRRDLSGLAKNLVLGAEELIGVKDKLTDEAISNGTENEDENV